MGNNVKLLREYLNLSQETFGLRIGIGKAAVSRIESNKNNLTKSISLLICKEFNVRYEWLTTGSGEMFENPRIDFKTQFLNALSSFTDEDWACLERLCRKILNSD